MSRLTKPTKHSKPNQTKRRMGGTPYFWYYPESLYRGCNTPTGILVYVGIYYPRYIVTPVLVRISDKLICYYKTHLHYYSHPYD